MDKDVIKNKLEEIWKRTNEHQGIQSVDVFKEVYGYDYDRDVNIGQFNPISYFLTRKVKMGDAFKNYKYGRYSILYVKMTGIGNKDLVDKFIHVLIYNVDKFFNLASFQRAARLTWELGEDETILSGKFIAAAKKVGWIKSSSSEYSFKVIEKPTREIRNQIRRILDGKISPAKIDVKPYLTSQKSSTSPHKIRIIEQHHYDDMEATIEKQMKVIADLQRLKVELLDENQEMSTELKIRNELRVNPEELLAAANAQL